MKRLFHTSVPRQGKPGVNTVAPVHHTVKYRNAQVSQRFRELLLPKTSIESSKFRPLITSPDRVKDHHFTTINSDLLLINYIHGAPEKKLGHKLRDWDGSSPYHVNRPKRPVKGQRSEPTKDIKRFDWRNIPEITGVTLHSFVNEAVRNPDLQIHTHAIFQQITGQKPSVVRSKSHIAQWGLRPGRPVGAKIHLKGRPMNQFLSTLTDIVLARSKTHKGISNRAGDTAGNIAFGLTPDEVKLFPELEGNLQLYSFVPGLQITIHTTAQTDKAARTLLSAYGFLFNGEER